MPKDAQEVGSEAGEQPRATWFCSPSLKHHTTLPLEEGSSLSKKTDFPLEDLSRGLDTEDALETLKENECPVQRSEYWQHPVGIADVPRMQGALVGRNDHQDDCIQDARVGWRAGELTGIFE